MQTILNRISWERSMRAERQPPTRMRAKSSAITRGPSEWTTSAVNVQLEEDASNLRAAINDILNDPFDFHWFLLFSRRRNRQYLLFLAANQNDDGGHRPEWTRRLNSSLAGRQSNYRIDVNKSRRIRWLAMDSVQGSSDAGNKKANSRADATHARPNKKSTHSACLCAWQRQQ